MNCIRVSLLFSICVILCGLVDEIKSAAISVPNTEDPNRPGYCFYDDYFGGGENKFHIKRESQRRHPTLCYAIKCDENYSLSTIGCGPGYSDNHCQLIADKNKPYPHCCGEWVC